MPRTAGPTPPGLPPEQSPAPATTKREGAGRESNSQAMMRVIGCPSSESLRPPRADAGKVCRGRANQWWCCGAVWQRSFRPLRARRSSLVAATPLGLKGTHHRTTAGLTEWWGRAGTPKKTHAEGYKQEIVSKAFTDDPLSLRREQAAALPLHGHHFSPPNSISRCCFLSPAAAGHGPARASTPAPPAAPRPRGAPPASAARTGTSGPRP